MENLNEILCTVFYNNTVEKYIYAFIIFISIILVGRYISRISTLWVIKTLSNNIPRNIYDTIVILLSILKMPFYISLSLYIISIYLTTSYTIKLLIFDIWSITAIFYITLFLQNIIVDIRKIMIENHPSSIGPSMIKVSTTIGIYIMWTISVIFILSNLGFAVSPIVTLLSVIGITIPLALQKILSDIFASFSLLADKPFIEGDFIIADGRSGTVRKIGIKTTRITSISGEELIIPNSNLTNMTIQNYGKMQHRRVLFEIHIKYDTPMEKLKEIPNIIKNIVSTQDFTTFDRCHFKEINNNYHVFEIVYFIENKDYNLFMNDQQNINLIILEELKNHNIELFHFTLQLNKFI